jgi:hypothetical protein
VQRREVVDAALIRIGAEGQQQPQDVVDVASILPSRTSDGFVSAGVWWRCSGG